MIRIRHSHDVMSHSHWQQTYQNPFPPVSLPSQFPPPPVLPPPSYSTSGFPVSSKQHDPTVWERRIGIFSLFFVAALLLYGQGAYLGAVGIPLIEFDPSFGIPLLVLFEVFWSLTSMSYILTVITDPGYTTKETRAPRDCRKCGYQKPLNAHHCSVCRHCVIEMDHHCPWVNKCIGIRNRKYFILLLNYTVLLSLWLIASVLTRWGKDPRGFSFVGEWNAQVIVSLIALVLGVVMGSATAGLSGYHWFLIWKGTTTIDRMAGRSNLNEHMTTWQSMKHVFGSPSPLWLLPVPPHFPMKKAPAAQ